MITKGILYLNSVIVLGASENLSRQGWCNQDEFSSQDNCRRIAAVDRAPCAPNLLPQADSRAASRTEPAALLFTAVFIEGQLEPALVEGEGEALFDVSEN